MSKEKALIIAEKKSLAEKLEAVISKHASEIPYDAKVCRMQGHLLELCMPPEIDEKMKKFEEANYPWFPDYIPYKVSEGYQKKLFYTIKQEYDSGKYDFVIHAGDPDQEGELLVREVLAEIECKLPVKRYWKNSEVEDEILDGLKNLNPYPPDFYENLYHAAKSRQTADYLIGMNLSPTVIMKAHESANVGRLKTFIVSLITEQEKKVEAFVPKTTYAIGSTYDHPDGEFKTETQEAYDTQDEANNVISGLPMSGEVTNFEEKTEKEKPPTLYKLSTLQADTGSTGLEVKEILDICQSLYEKEFTTYPRTSCEFIESKVDLRKFLKACRCFDEFVPVIDSITDADIDRVYKDSKYINDKKTAESGHQALTPTGKKVDLSKLNDKEILILKIIYKRFISIFLAPIVRKKRWVTVMHDDMEFKAVGTQIIDKGFAEFTEAELKETFVPVLNKGDKLTVKEYSLVEKKATPPKRFTQASLIGTLENPKKFIEDERVKKLPYTCGIGTEATRSACVNELIQLGYIANNTKGKTKTLMPTDKAKRYCKYLDGSRLCKADTTMLWEEQLEHIRKGEMDGDEFVDGIKHDIIDEIENIKNNEFSGEVFCKCFNCGGDVIEFPIGYSCMKCKAGIRKDSKYFEVRKKKVTPDIAKTLLSTGTVDLIDCVSQKKDKNGKPIKYDLRIKATVTDRGLEYDSAFIDDKKDFCECPVCHGRILEDKMKYACENSPKCTCQLWKKDAYFATMGKTITPEMAKDFFTKGESLVKGLRAKDGKTKTALVRAEFGGKFAKYSFVEKGSN